MTSDQTGPSDPLAPAASSGETQRLTGFLGWIERTGNALPDPVLIFAWLMLAVVILSAIAAGLGWSAVNPVTNEVIAAKNLLTGEQIRSILVDMPDTFTGFRPLGLVLLVMLGAGVAERSGLFSAAIRAGVRRAPLSLLTPVVAFIAMMSNLAADAAYVVLIPLAGVVYAGAGRHPVAGIAAAFAGVSGGFTANLLPGSLDALLFGITQEGATILVSSWTPNIAGNWFFMAVLLLVFMPVVWFVTDRIIEPRLGAWSPSGEAAEATGTQDGTLRQEEVSGLRMAGLAVLGISLLWAYMGFGPGAPLRDDSLGEVYALQPFYRSLIAFFFLLFLGAAIAYGVTARTIRSHRDVVDMMTGSMGAMSYYIVLAFVAAHFVAFFAQSNLGIILAVQGAQLLKASGLPGPLLLVAVVLLTASVNLFVGSASAKWAFLAPILVPMLMLLSISPEMTTAAFRVGDSATNIITPLLPYFPLILTFCQRWQPDFGLGSLMAVMLPYSLYFMASGLVVTMLWALLGLPLGPNAGIEYSLPQ